MLVEVGDDPEGGLQGGGGPDSGVLSGPTTTGQDTFWALIRTIEDPSDTPQTRCSRTKSLRALAVLPKLVDVVAGQRGRDTALDASRGEAGAVRGAGTPVVITTALGLLVALLLGCASTTAGAETHTSSQSPVITTTAPPATASPAGGQSDPSRSGGSPITSGDPAGPGAATVPGTSPNDVGSEAGSGAPGTPGSATPGPGQDVPARTVPAERMRAVFVGEPCVPSVDSVPRQAVNGLLLYCGQADSGQPRWGVASPPPPQGPVVPVPGTECDARTDGDGVVQGADGRLVACIRDLDGSSRWSDAS